MVLMYLRKSRADSPDSTVEEVLAKHESILQEYSVQHYGHPIEPQNILKEVVSGETISDRPQMKLLLSRIVNEDIDEVLVVEPQRLTRGDLVDCGTVIRVFKYSNTKIVTPTKTFDLTDKYDEKFLTMTLQQGNDYLEYFKAITARGRIASVKKGCYLGNTAPYGYDKTKVDKMPTLTPNEEAPFVKMMFDMCCKGYGTGVIANTLNDKGIKPKRADHWTAGSIRDILKNETYTGKVRWSHRSMHNVVDENGNIHKEHKRNKEYLVAEGLHPALVDTETFDKVQTILGNVTREHSQTELKNIFAGLIKCKCGHNYVYRSYSWARPRIHCTHQKFCHTPSIAYDDFLADFVEELKAILPNVNIEGEVDDNNDDIIQGLNQQLASLENTQLKLYEFLEKGIYTEEVFEKRNANLDDERQRLLNAIEIAEKDNKKSRGSFATTLHAALDTLMDERYSTKSKNTLLKSFIAKIEIDSGIKIYFK